MNPVVIDIDASLIRALEQGTRWPEITKRQGKKFRDYYWNCVFAAQRLHQRDGHQAGYPEVAGAS